MAIYQIKSFRGALADYEDKGTDGSFKFGSNLDVRKRVDSLSCQQALSDEGLHSSASPSLSVSPSLSPSRSLSPSPSASPSETPTQTASESVSVSLSPSVTKSASRSPSASVSLSPSPTSGLTTVFEDLIHTFVKGSDGYTYGFGNTGCIYRRDLDGFWQRVYKDPDGAILGAAEWYSETGKTYLYWATLRKLKRKVMPGLSDWNDVQEVANSLEEATWHTMREAGGSLIICNGPFLALVGYDDSFTNEALDLIPGNIANTIVERNGRSIVGTKRAYDLTRGINGAIDAEVPLAQVGNDGELYYADMVNSMPFKRFPGGGQVNPGGVCNEVDQVNFFEWEQNALSWIDKQSVGNLALFAVYSADSGKNGIYTYGRKNKNHPSVLNLDYALDADELGAVVNVEGKTLVSYRDGSDFGVKYANPNVKATGTYEGLDFRAPVKKPVNITKWGFAEIFCSPLPTGTSIEFWYRMNKTGSFVQALMEGNVTQFSTTGEKKATFLVEAEGEIFEARLVLNPIGNDSPEVHRIRVYFD